MNKLLIGVTVLIMLSGCADTVSFEQAMLLDSVGFWYGLWHGITFPFSLFGSLVFDDIAVYAIYNNGGWYNFGFWFGLCFLGSTFFLSKSK